MRLRLREFGKLGLIDILAGFQLQQGYTEDLTSRYRYSAAARRLVSVTLGVGGGGAVTAGATPPAAVSAQ